MWSKWGWNSSFFTKNKNRPATGAMPPDLRLYKIVEYHFAKLATQSKHFSNKKTWTFKPTPLAKFWLHTNLSMWRRVENEGQQNHLFCCLKDQLFLFFRAHSSLFRLQSLLQIDFSSDYGLEKNWAKKCYQTYMSLFYTWLQNFEIAHNLQP